VAATDPAHVVLCWAEMIHQDPPAFSRVRRGVDEPAAGPGPALVFPISWLEQRLAERGQTIEHAYELTTQSQAADHVSIRNSIESIRLLSAIDLA